MPDRPHPKSDDDLGQALRLLGAELDYPVPDGLSERVRAELAARPRGSWRDRLSWLARPGWRRSAGPSRRPAWQAIAAAAALVLVVFVASLVAFPSVRATVADWLGLRGIGISVVPSLAPLPTTYRSLGFGRPVTLDEARSELAWPVLLPTDPELGPPDEVYIDQSLPDGAVSFVWAARPGIPVSSAPGAGLVLTEFRATIDQRFLQKIVGPGTAVAPVHVDGRTGDWITGAPHEVFVVDRSGQPIPATIRLAGNVLMWEDGELTLRLEGELALETAMRIAASVR